MWLVMMGLTLAAAASLVYVFYTMAGPVSLPVKEGMPAPAFGLQDQSARLVRLSDFKDRWVLLYFYPKDDTPGCTREACGLRDHHGALVALGLQVLGVSLDSVDSHRRFAEKFRLPYPLLADADHAVCRAYGTLVNLFGFKVARRSSFLIGPDGIVRKVFPKVNPARHSEEVAKILKRMINGDNKVPGSGFRGPG
ncbi:MAG TPA: peroxiredoxin [Nitrospiria bacterium]|nr:peroxiredoxin [Nitrospiria bacterium]